MSNYTFYSFFLVSKPTLTPWNFPWFDDMKKNYGTQEDLERFLSHKDINIVGIKKIRK
jgi:hypothetical protein